MRLALAVLTLLVVATPTSAQFDAVTHLSPVQTLSAEAGHAFNTTVAIDPNGNAVFAWGRFHDLGEPFVVDVRSRIEARALSAGGVLSDVQRLSPFRGHSSAARVGVDAAGNAVFMWSRRGCVFCLSEGKMQARGRSAGGILSPVQTISRGAFARSPALAVSRSGNAVFAWSGFDGRSWRIKARARSVDGILSPVQTLSPAGKEAGDPQIGLDYYGNAVIGWVHSDGTHERLFARAHSVDGALSPVRAISPAGKSASMPNVAVAPSGHAVFAWRQTTDEAPQNGRIWVRARYADGTLTPVEMISPIPVALADVGSGALSPKVAVDADGNAVFIWQVEESANGDGRYFLQTRARSVSGTLSVVQFVTDSNERTLIGSARGPQLAVDATGNAVFTWQRYNGAHWRIQTRARSADGVLSDVQTLSASGADAHDAEVATNDSGHAVFTWARSDGTNDRSQTRARSAP